MITKMATGYKGAPKKRITKVEKTFAEYMDDNGVGPIESARQVFGWKCTPESPDAKKALSIANSRRVRE